MKRVKLDYDHTVTIEDAAFEQISAIVQNSMVCETPEILRVCCPLFHFACY